MRAAALPLTALATDWIWCKKLRGGRGDLAADPTADGDKSQAKDTGEAATPH